MGVVKKNFLLFLAAACFLLIVFSLFPKGEKKVSKTPEQSAIACNPSSLTGEIDFSDSLAFFEDAEVRIPDLAYANDTSNVLGVAHEERWIEVDLSDQKLKAWEGNNLFLETPVSTGLPWTPTPQGEFRIWIKLRATKMEGGSGKYYYYLPNVPYVMYFENADVPGWKGYGLHGTYWHSDFGTQRSHGCVNLPTDIAGQLYYWTTPTLPDGKSAVRTTSDNPGTRIVIHE